MDEVHYILQDLEEISKKVINDKQRIQNCVEDLTKNKQAREQKRKEILLREMKEILALLAIKDENMIKEFKGDAYDKGNEASKIFEDANALQCRIKQEQNPENVSKLKVKLESLKERAQNLGLDFFISSANLQVSYPPLEEASKLRKNYNDIIFYASGSLNPKQFTLSIPKCAPSLELPDNLFEIHILHPDQNIMQEAFTLQKLMITVSNPEAGTTLEQSSALDKLSKNQGRLKIHAGISLLVIHLKKQSSVTNVSVKMFESNIAQSPAMIDSNANNATLMNNSIAIFDTTSNNVPAGYEGLDSSDMKSLDITGRLLQQQQPPRRASKQPNMSTVAEERSVNISRPAFDSVVPRPILKPFVVHDPPGSASNSPFAPKSKSMASTMKGDVWEPVGESPLVVNNCPDTEFDVPDATMHSVVDDSKIVTMKIGDEGDVDDENDDPYLLLNASKAPSPASANKTIVPDEAWEDENFVPPVPRKPDLNESCLPAYSVMVSDESLWSEVEESQEKFDFIKGDLEISEVLKSSSVVNSSSKGKFLKAPSSIACVRELNIMLITEPKYNRIGVYNARNLEFVQKMAYPKYKSQIRNYFNCPTSILHFGNYLAIIEKDQMLIFSLEHYDGDWICNLSRRISGTFHGLSKGPNNQILSILEKNQQFFVAVIESKKVKELHHMPIHNAEISKMRFLTNSGNLVVLTDQGMHRIVQLNLETKQFKVTGYMGSKLGQFNQPTGVVFDDNDSVLIGDSGNNRLLVFNRNLQIVKVVKAGEGYKHPQDILRIGRHVYVVYTGTTDSKDSEGVVIKYKLKVDGSSLDSTPYHSDNNE